MTSSVPRGEIQRTVWVAVSAERAPVAPRPDRNDRPTPAAAARLRRSPRLISLANASFVLSSMPSAPFACGCSTLLRPASCLPARPAFVDEVEDHVDQAPEDRDDKDRRAELGHARERRVVDEAPAEAALLARGDHIPADRRQQPEDRADH